MKLLIISLLSAMIIMSYGKVLLHTVMEWHYVDFDWGSEQNRQEAVTNNSVYGGYDPLACVLYDVDVTKDCTKLFVTSVRDVGVPASLMTVTDQMGEGGPLLRPYPNWSWHRLDKNCSDRITGAYRVDIKCGLVFVLDSGKIGEDAICRPQLLIFNLTTDEMVKRVEIPDSVAVNNQTNMGLLVTAIVYDVSCCKDILNRTVVYIADVEGAAIIVWEASSNTFCRFESDSMQPIDSYFTIVDQSFYLNDSIIGMTFTNNKLFYAPLAGKRIYKTKGKDLICPISCNGTTQNINNETQCAAKLYGQTGPMASEGCAIFYSNVPQTSIWCKNAVSCNEREIIANSVKLQFISGMKTRNGYLLLLSNRLQRTMTDTRDLKEINYRILKIFLSDIRREQPICFASCNNDHCDHCYQDQCHNNYYYRSNYYSHFYGRRSNYYGHHYDYNCNDCCNNDHKYNNDNKKH